MEIFLNTTMIYYLGLYLLVFVVRFFKPPRGTPQPSQDWHDFFSYSSLEIIYTASGFLVILFGREIRLLPVFFVLYTLLLFTSSNIDRLDRFSAKAKTVTHAVIIALVIGVTVLSFSTKLKDEGDNIVIYRSSERQAAVAAPKQKNYDVVLFYDDHSLIAHVGLNNWSGKTLSFRVKAEGASKEEAVREAVRLFWESPVSKPFRLRSWETREGLVRINEHATLVFEIP